MIRGTTPTITFTLPFDTNTLDAVWITFSQNDEEVFTLDNSEFLLNGNTITVNLTQKHTLQLTSRGKVEIQIRCKTIHGQAIASKPITTWVERILKDGEI